jgi:hypothetical protein
MEMQEFIPIDIFCRQHGVEVAVVSSLQEYGLIEISKIEEVEYIQLSSLADAEKLVRLYGELNINLEGIDVIIHLLHRIKEMQAEMQLLKNRLGLYEDL